MKNNKLLLFVATVMVALPLCGQNGYLDRFPDLKGDSIISRISDDGHYKITCYHSNCNIACFLVTDGNVTYNYPTSVCVESNPLNPMPALNQGYIVRDIKIKGDTCWVCGSFWRETGNWIYTQQGLEYWEVEYTGYVGYFMLSNMTSGFCFMRYVKIPFIESINKMVVIGKSVETIGSYGSNEGLYVGLTRNNDNQWEYILGKSSYQEEQFKGITYTGGKVVVLSRFNNIQHVMFYKHGMGLRYGYPSAFIPTSQRIYLYSTRDVDNSSDLDFDPEAPLVFDKANENGAVTAGYVCNPTVPMDMYRGHMVFFVFSMENDHHPICMYNVDNQRFKSIKEMSCLKPDKMAVLLEDSLNNSVIRFSPQYKKILSLDDCMMMSLDTYVSSPYDMGVFLGGKKSSVQKTIMCLSERNIVSRVNNWHPGNCLSDYNGAMEIRECYSPYAPIDSTMITIHEDKADVKIVKFYPTEVDTVRDCTDIN